MNLTTEPWIPVSDSQGVTRLVSLRQVFAEGDPIQDLAVRPHERVALMRLLICIAQAALDGPADRQARAAELPAAAGCYLDKWQESFNLFHPEKPFLQFPGLNKPPKPKKPKKNAPAPPDTGDDEGDTPATKLDFALSTGNNTTLFDNAAAREDARAFSPAQLAMMLITFQCFSPGGRIGVAQWRSVDTPGKGSSGHAPCAPSAMLHAFARSSTLLDSIRANLLSKWSVEKNYRRASWGRPVWEQMPESFSDAPAIANATSTYLGRLMPLARAILLRADGKSLLLANGLDYPTPPDFPAEPTASLVLKSDKSGHVLVGARLEKAIWRELPSIIVKRLADDPGGPLVLGELDDGASLDLWIGALITDKASIIDTVEGVYSIPARMLNDNGCRAFEAEVKESERIERNLRYACKDYRQHLELKPQAYPEQTAALRRYWTTVEQRLPLLYQHINAPDGSDEAKKLLNDWRNSLWDAARDAFTTTCANETPRQLRAYSLALSSLNRCKQKPDDANQPQSKP